MMRHRTASFTLTELMVIVAIIGILSTTALIPIQRIRFERQRTAINNAVRDLATWLELMRAEASRGGACTVTVTTSLSLAAGSTLASVTPTTCGNNLILDPDTAFQAGPIAVSTNPSTTTIVFTSTGGAQPSSSVAVDGFNAVEVRLSSSAANLRRCLAISNGTGSLRFGAADTSGGTCSYTAPL